MQIEKTQKGFGPARVRTIPVLRLALSYLRVLVPVVLPMHRISSDCLFKSVFFLMLILVLSFFLMLIFMLKFFLMLILGFFLILRSSFF